MRPRNCRADTDDFAAPLPVTAEGLRVAPRRRVRQRPEPRPDPHGAPREHAHADFVLRARQEGVRGCAWGGRVESGNYCAGRR